MSTTLYLLPSNEQRCSTYIYFGEDITATRIDLPVYIGSVPTEHLDTFHEKFQACLKGIVEEGIDMKRMTVVIDRDERQVRRQRLLLSLLTAVL